MATLTIPDDVYQQLSRHAIRREISVEELVLPVLKEAAAKPVDPEALELFKQRMENFIERARLRADRYPPGFEADVSRESIYEGCGE